MKPVRVRAVPSLRPGYVSRIPAVFLACILGAVAILVFGEWWGKFPFVPELFLDYFRRDARFLVPVWPGIAKTVFRALIAVSLLAAFEFASWRAGASALVWAVGRTGGGRISAIFSLGIGNGLAGIFALAAGLNGLLIPALAWSLFILVLFAAVYDWHAGGRARSAGGAEAAPAAPAAGNDRELRLSGPQEEGQKWSLAEKVLLGFCGFIIVGNFLPALEPEWFYDSLVYHLAVPQQYLLNHKIYHLSYTFFSNFPFLQEMQYLVFLSLGNDISPRLLHWFEGALCAAAVFCLGRLFLGRAESIFAAAVFLSQSSLRFLMHVTMVELGLTWFSLLAILAFVRAVGLQEENAPAGTVRMKWLFLAAWFLGFGQGTKYLGIITSVLLIAWVFLTAPRTRAAFRPAAAAVALIVAWASAWTLPWLIKNWVFTGNPVFPFLPGVFETINWSPGLYAAWMADNVKYGTGHGGFWNVLTMPLKASIEDSNFGTFTLNPFYILFLPMLVFARRVPRHVVFLAAYSALYFLIWGATSQQTRFLMPMAAIASVVASFVVAGFWRLGLATGLPAAAVTAWILVMATYGQFENRHSNNALVPYTTGHLDRLSLLRIGVQYYPVLEAAARVVPKESRLLFIGGDESYYCTVKYVCNSIYDRSAVGDLARRARSGGELKRLLDRLRVSHVIIHEPRAEEYVRYGIFDWGGSARDVFLDFMSKHLRMIRVSGGVFLFEVTDEPIPPAERKVGVPLYLCPPGAVIAVKDLLGKADFLFKRGRLEEGKMVAQEIVRLAPEVGLSYSYRGYANSLLGLEKEATNDYERAIRLGYPTSSVYYNLALLLEKNRKFERALEVQMEVIRMEPAWTNAKERAASLALVLGRRDLALSLAEELKALRPRDPDLQRRVDAIVRAAAGAR